MIHRKELLDPTSVDRLPEEERRILDGAQNAGHGPRRLNIENSSSGALQQVVIASAIIACEAGSLGCESDISEGRSTLREMFEDLSSEMALEGTVE